MNKPMIGHNQPPKTPYEEAYGSRHGVVWSEPEDRAA